MTKRNVELILARVAGYHQDNARFNCLVVERRTASHAALLEAWRTGCAP